VALIKELQKIGVFPKAPSLKRGCRPQTARDSPKDIKLWNPPALRVPPPLRGFAAKEGFK